MFRPIAHEITTDGVWLELNRTQTANALRTLHSWPTRTARASELRTGRTAMKMGLDVGLAIFGGCFAVLIAVAQIGGAL